MKPLTPQDIRNQRHARETHNKALGVAYLTLAALSYRDTRRTINAPESKG